MDVDAITAQTQGTLESLSQQWEAEVTVTPTASPGGALIGCGQATVFC